MLFYCPEVESSPPEWKLDLGEATDPDSDDPLRLEVNLGATNSFIQFDSDSNTLALNQTAVVLTGNYTIAIYLSDSHDTKKYYIQLAIECPSGDAFEVESNENSILDKLLALNQTDETEKRKDRPIPSIRSINETGYAIIRFSQPLVPLENATALPNETTLINGTEHPAFEIKVKPGFYSKLENVEFEYEVVKQTATELHVQLNFTSYEWISFLTDPEWLYITFWDPSNFTNIRGDSVAPETQLKRQLPPQVSLKDLEFAETLGKIVQIAIVTVAVVTVILSPYYSFSLQYVLGMVKKLQISCHMMLINV